MGASEGARRVGFGILVVAILYSLFLTALLLYRAVYEAACFLFRSVRGSGGGRGMHRVERHVLPELSQWLKHRSACVAQALPLWVRR